MVMSVASPLNFTQPRLLRLLIPLRNLEALLAQRFTAHRRHSQLALLALAVTPFCSAQAVPAATPRIPAQPSAELGMPVLENHSYKEYRSGDQVWTILQDRRGLMYFGVSGGVILQYDGVTWRKIFLTSNVTRSLAIDDAGRIWVGGNGDIGYLAPDAAGTLQFVSILDKVPPEHRDFTSVWQTLVTPQGIFFRTYERLFRWDGKRMQVWPRAPNASFQALSTIHGHIYTAQDGVGLEEIVGDELRSVPGGDAYKTSRKLFLHPFDENRILVSAAINCSVCTTARKSLPSPPRRTTT